MRKLRSLKNETLDSIFLAELLFPGYEKYDKRMKKIYELKTADEQINCLREVKEFLAAYYVLDGALKTIQRLQDERAELLEKIDGLQREISVLEHQVRVGKMEGVVTVET